MATSDVSSLPATNKCTESASKTDIKLLKCSHTWTINNFSKCWMKPGEELQSPTFSSEVDDKIKWCLAIYPGGKNEEHKDYVSLYLTLVSSYIEEFRVKYEFYILNDKREKTNEYKTSEATKFLQTSSVGRHRFVLRSFLMDNANKVLPNDNLSIFCELDASAIIPITPTIKSNVLIAADHWGCTKVDVVKVTYMWTISNFSFCKEKTGQRMASPIFPDDANSKFQWELQLFPNGQDEKVKEYLSIFLHPKAVLEEDVIASYNFSIINSEREKTNKLCHNYHTFLKGSSNGRGFPQFVKRDFLLNKANGLLSDDKLVIFCEVSYAADVVNIAGKNSKPITLEMPECRLADDLETLLKNQRWTDVTLVGCERELRAHKAILAARSSVFSDMFEKETDDKSVNRVEILDVDYTVLQEMLRFIYTGNVRNIGGIASALLTAADKYNLEKLKVMCEQALCPKIGIENAAQMLILAHEHGAGHLKTQTLDFFNAHAKEVMDSVEFQLMFDSHPELIAELALEHLLSLKKNGNSNELLLFDKEQKSSI